MILKIETTITEVEMGIWLLEKAYHATLNNPHFKNTHNATDEEIRAAERFRQKLLAAYEQINIDKEKMMTND